MKTQALVLFFAASSAFAQGTFQNLDFESANIIVEPGPGNPYYPYTTSVTNGLPEWTPYGSFLGGYIFYDDISIGAPSISIHDTNRFFPIMISGQYTVFLQAGTYPDRPPANVALGQVGLVPLDARSIQFKASAPLSLSVQGQTIPIFQIGSGPNYALWGGDISQFAGQTVDLRISTLQTPQNLWYSSSLDDITFSPVAIPEPSVLTLSALATGLLGCWISARLLRSHIRCRGARRRLETEVRIEQLVACRCSHVGATAERLRSRGSGYQRFTLFTLSLLLTLIESHWMEDRGIPT